VLETTGERPRWLAEEPVLIALVSKAEFPAIRDINREFLEIWSLETNSACSQIANSMTCSKIPYAMEQGINSGEQGNPFEQQGILEFSPRIERTATTVADLHRSIIRSPNVPCLRFHIGEL
jgi:hypothetical protein